MDDFKNTIIIFLKKETGLESIDLEIPPNPEMGDYAFPCFSLSKIWKKVPKEIALDISAKFKPDGMIIEARAMGPYVNFFVDKGKLAEHTINSVIKQNDKFGSLGIGKGKKILLEHTSINPNASPHIGRTRGALIGDSIARILRFADYEVEVHYFVNDVGKQIAMLVLAAEGIKKITFGKLLDLYVGINKKIEENPDLEKDVLGILGRLENGDGKTRKQFEKIVGVCVNGQEKILSALGIKYDFFDYESKYLWNKKTDETLRRLEKTGKLFIDGFNRRVLDQKGYSLGMKMPVLVLTRADGTSLYPLRDIAYAIEMVANGDYIVVLGEDQKLYNEQVNAALKELKILQRKSVHFSFVLLEEGKMSTRKGNVVLLEDFMRQSVEKARKELEKRYKKANDRTAKAIAYGAIKFGMLRISPEKNVLFKWEQALSFEGESAPYIQYAHARIKSIIKKYDKHEKISSKFFRAGPNLLMEKEEIALIKSISEFPDIVEKAAKELRPHLIATYVYSLAQKFNEYYHIHQILRADDKIREARIFLISAVAQVIRNGLILLGINALERM